MNISRDSLKKPIDLPIDISILDIPCSTEPKTVITVYFYMSKIRKAKIFTLEANILTWREQKLCRGQVF